MDQALHDLTNALAAARAYGEVLHNRAAESDASLLQSLLDELDRGSAIVRAVRAGAYQSYAPGDVLECMKCGCRFVHRKAPGRHASCRRCHSLEVTRWHP